MMRIQLRVGSTVAGKLPGRKPFVGKIVGFYKRVKDYLVTVAVQGGDIRRVSHRYLHLLAEPPGGTLDIWIDPLVFEPNRNWERPLVLFDPPKKLIYWNEFVTEAQYRLLRACAAEYEYKGSPLDKLLCTICIDIHQAGPGL